MRIVIIGEFSSFSRNLSEGIKQIGHECFVFSWADGFKGISQHENSSYNVSLRKCGRGGIISHLKNAIYSFCSFIKLSNFVRRMAKGEKWDAALIINPVFIKRKRTFWTACFTENMIKSLLRDQNQVFLSACGRDVPFFDYWKNRRWRNWHIIEIGLDEFYKKNRKSHFEYCMSFIHKSIPVMYMYAEAWRKSSFTESCKVYKTIPLPVNVAKYKVRNVLEDKIVVFHGIIRPEEKGTPLIIAAMNKLQDCYPESVECIAKGGMPLDEYLPLLSRTNILIDQVYSDSVGMNGLYALAMGKVVLGGNAYENQVEFDSPDCPVVNIEPNIDDIYKKLEELILNRDLIVELSRKSREYVARVHDAKIIAQKYVEVFGMN